MLGDTYVCGSAVKEQRNAGVSAAESRRKRHPQCFHGQAKQLSRDVKAEEIQKKVYKKQNVSIDCDVTVQDRIASHAYDYITYIRKKLSKQTAAK